MRSWSIVVAAALGLSAAGTAAAAPGNLYEVLPGESLWTIAARTVGDPTLWPALYRANRDQIKDPSVLYPGQKLTIPAIDPSERQAVRREAEALGTR